MFESNNIVSQSNGQAKRRTTFPPYPQFSGFMRPTRFEGDCRDLEVEGEIPAALDGVFYRVMPDPQQVPYIENDPVCLLLE